MAHPIGIPIAPSRLRAVTLVAALFVFFLAAYIFTASGDIFSQGDTTIRIELAENILGRASVELNGWKLQYPHHIKQEYFDPRVSVGRLHATYSTYLPGQPLAIIPLDYMGAQWAIHEKWPYGTTVFWIDRMVGPLFGALEATLFFLFAVRLGFTRGKSFFLSCLFAFASSAWPDEQSVLEHTEVSFFLLLAMYFAYRFRQQGRSWWYAAFSGAAIGGAFSTRYQDAFVGAIAVGIYLLLPGLRPGPLIDRVRACIVFGLGLLPFVLLVGYYSWYRFGSPLASGHHERVFGYPIWLGIPGLLISPGKGLLWYSPVILLLGFTGRRFFRRFPALSVGFGVMVAGFVLLYSYVMYWHGDPSWGPRYIYVVLPYLILPLGELFSFRGRRAVLVWLVSAVVILTSFTIQVAAVSVPQWRSWYRVISYEENQGREWQWIAARYSYFWNIHESPLNFQVHGLYQLLYDSAFHSQRYSLVPPDEDPVLDKMSVDYAVNQFSIWWAEDEFNWWMGQEKVLAGAVMLAAITLASGTYVVAETTGLFAKRPTAARPSRSIHEAA